MDRVNDFSSTQVAHHSNGRWSGSGGHAWPRSEWVFRWRSEPRSSSGRLFAEGSQALRQTALPGFEREPGKKSGRTSSNVQSSPPPTSPRAAKHKRKYGDWIWATLPLWKWQKYWKLKDILLQHKSNYKKRLPFWKFGRCTDVAKSQLT